MTAPARYSEMERLGETWEFGRQLLRILELNGWTIVDTPAFGGGRLVEASKNGVSVKRVGATLADVAPDVFSEAARMQSPRRAVQLELL